MKRVRGAVIDIGTNSIKLLVADIADGAIQPVREESHQTRLGQGFYESHRLQPGPIEQTARSVAEFVGKARDEHAASIRLIATSAARDAVNANDLTSAIERSSGLKVEIISGEQEADFVFQGITTDPALAEVPLLVLDVGGGSTEFIVGKGAEKHFRESFPLGTVRLLEKLRPGDPPSTEELAGCRRWLKAFLQRRVKSKVETALQREMKGEAAGEAVQLVGTGGTASILGCMEAGLTTFERERLEATRLPFQRLHQHVEKLWNLPLNSRKEIVGLPKNRADVILTGSAIYEAILEEFGFDELRISTRGLRFAALLDCR